jgi:hypothetical protein
MSSSSSNLGGIEAGRAYVRIGTEESELVAGLDKAAARVQKFGAAVRGIGLQAGFAGAAVFAPLAAASGAYAQHGEQLDLNSKKTGVSVEDLSTLGYAAQQSGVDTDSLTVALNKMGRTLTQAQQGSRQATDAFRTLGIDLQSLTRLNPDQRFKAIADALADVSDPSVRAAEAMAIFGRAGAQLLPLLDQGSSGIQAMEDHAKALGLQWSGPDAAAATQFSQALRDMWDVGRRLVELIGSAVAPVMKQAAQLLTVAGVGAQNFIKNHQELLQTIVKVAGAVVLFGGGLIILGTTIQVAGIAIGAVASVLGIFVTALTTIWALFNPVTLGIVLIARGLSLLGIQFGFVSKAGQTMANYLKGVWASIKTDALAAFGGIHDAIAGGDWALAAQILWSVLQLEFAKGVGQLKLLWNGITKPLLTTWNNVVYGIWDAWEIVRAGLENGWSHTVAFIETLINKISQGIKTGFEDAVDFATRQLLKIQGLTPEQLQQANAMEDETYADALDQINKSAGDTQSGIDTDEAKNTAQHNADRDAALAALAEANKAENDAIAAKDKADADKIQAHIDDLKKQLADLDAKAKSEASKKTSPMPGRGDAPDLDEADLQKAAKHTKEKMNGFFGGLNTTQLNQVLGNGPSNDFAKQTADNTKKTNQILTQIAVKRPSDSQMNLRTT